MRGIYLQCDKCNATIGGEDVTPKQQGIPTLKPEEGDRLRTLASDIGWSHYADDYDLCPNCGATHG